MLLLGKQSQGAVRGLCEHQKPGRAGAGLVCFLEQCRDRLQLLCTRAWQCQPPGWGLQQGKMLGEASKGWGSWQEVKKSSSEEALFQTLYV